jgi:hypothetical protein
MTGQAIIDDVLCLVTLYSLLSTAEVGEEAFSPWSPQQSLLPHSRKCIQVHLKNHSFSLSRYARSNPNHAHDFNRFDKHFGPGVPKMIRVGAGS